MVGSTVGLQGEGHNQLPRDTLLSLVGEACSDGADELADIIVLSQTTAPCRL